MYRKKIVLIMLCLLLFVSCADAAVQYAVIDLGQLTEDSYSEARAINNSGVIAGYAGTDNGPMAFQWQNGTMTVLDTPLGYNSHAVAINSNGDIVGTTDPGDPLLHRHASIWRNGVLTDLGTLGGPYSFSYADSINDAGQVVGYSDANVSYDHAFIWEDGVMTDLNIFGVGRSRAYDINNSGQVVGTADASDGTSHAFIWQNGTVTDLGRFGAVAINDLGQIAGIVRNTQDNSNHAFLWYDGTFTDLGSLGRTDTNVTGFNNLGQIVGQFYLTGLGYQPFIWRDGVMTNLNDLIISGGYIMYDVKGINDRGQIVGYGYSPGGSGGMHAFLLNPVPEPSSLLAILTGIGGIGGIWLRRRK